METKLLVYLLPIVIAYIIGSFLPGYFLPLWLKKVDTRKIGDGNPGTINVKRTLGYPLAVIVGIYDVSKGLASMYIAYRFFNAPDYIIVLSAFASIMGHKFPFYLGFRGGRGIATTVGIFVFLIVKIMKEFFSSYDIIIFIMFIITYALLIMLSTHDEDFFTVTVFPVIGAILAMKVESHSELLLVLFLMGMIFYESSKNLKLKMFQLSSEKHTLWRVLMRPMALIFILLSLFIDIKSIVFLTGSVLFILFVFDILRFAIPKFELKLERELLPNFKILRTRERGKISSMTNFMLGIFLVFVLFPENIAYAAIGFSSLGDMLAKIAGMNFGETKIFKRGNKSIEGTMSFLAASLGVAYIMWISGSLALWIGTAGAVVAALVESFPSQIDDNLSVPVISGAFMQVLTKFLL